MRVFTGRWHGSPSARSSSAGRATTAVSLACILAACSGSESPVPNDMGASASGGSGATSSGGASNPEDTAGAGGTAPLAGAAGMPLDCGAPNVGASPMRRLTRREYNNVVRDLLRDTTRPAEQFVPESEQSGFSNGADSTLLSAVVVDDFEVAATVLAKEATTGANLATLVGCDPSVAAEQDDCAARFIPTFGARAFRRSLDDAQVADYQSLYASTKAASGFAVAIELVVRAMLQSPFFLYRLELGTGSPGGTEVVPLTPEETAARLSFLLWGSIPDEPLMQAAREGNLTTSEEVRAQAVRMLADDRGAALFSDFHVQWGQLEGLPNQTKPVPFTPELGRLLIEETEHFVDQTLRKGDGLLSTLLTSPVAYLNSQLAEYYGVSGVTGEGFESVTMPAGQRSGLLTQGSFMGNFAHGTEPSPVLRGKFILTQLACSPPPAPPDDLDTTLPPPDPAKSARQQLVELTSEGTCAGCHRLLNPAGFAFEHFDGLGRYRTMEGQFAVDASSKVVVPADMAGMYQDHEGFLSALANSQTVRSCLTSKWFIYAHGRIPEPEDACSISSALTDFQNTGNVRELILRMTETPAFLYYRPSAEGTAP